MLRDLREGGESSNAFRMYLWAVLMQRDDDVRRILDASRDRHEQLLQRLFDTAGSHMYFSLTVGLSVMTLGGTALPEAEAQRLLRGAVLVSSKVRQAQAEGRGSVTFDFIPRD